MQHFEAGVAVARWEHHEGRAALADVRRDVAGFAARHGMPLAARRDVEAAVAEAVAVAAGPVAEDGVRVAAATDGRWLSVEVRGRRAPAAHETDPAVVLPLAGALAARVEWDPGSAGSGATTLMEFAMDRPAGAAPGPAACVRRRRPASPPPRRARRG